MGLKSIFSITLLMLICGTMSSPFAKTPTTPKILFTSRRDGNLEVYMMNPDGSEVLYTQGFGALYIFKVDVNTGIRTQLTHTATDFGADWFDPAFALPVEPQPALLTTTWGELKTENPDGRK